MPDEQNPAGLSVAWRVEQLVDETDPVGLVWPDPAEPCVMLAVEHAVRSLVALSEPDLAEFVLPCPAVPCETVPVDGVH